MRRGVKIGCGVFTVACWSCLPPEGGDAAWSLRDASDIPSSAPVVGRLQYQDRVVDLTVDAFADGPNGAAVDPGSYAKVMADIDKDVRSDRSSDSNASWRAPIVVDTFVPGRAQPDFDRR